MSSSTSSRQRPTRRERAASGKGAARRGIARCLAGHAQPQRRPPLLGHELAPGVEGRVAQSDRGVGAGGASAGSLDPGRQWLADDDWPVQRDVVLAVDATGGGVLQWGWRDSGRLAPCGSQSSVTTAMGGTDDPACVLGVRSFVAAANFSRCVSRRAGPRTGRPSCRGPPRARTRPWSSHPRQGALRFMAAPGPG